MKTPSLEELEGKSKNDLQNYCDSLVISYIQKDTKRTLLDKLKSFIKQTQEGQETQAPNNIDRSSQKGNNQEFISNFQTLPFPKEENEKDRIGHLNTISYLLPVSSDELLQYWQRGFICHPKVIAHLAKTSSVHHDSSDLIEISSINLSKHYDTKASIFMELDVPFAGAKPEVDHRWIGSIDIIKKIIVDSPDTSEQVKRLLTNSNRGLDDWLPIEYGLLDKGINFEKVDKSNIVEIVEEIIADFELIDSLLGGFAVSNYMERNLLLAGKHPLNKINIHGSFFDSLIGKSGQSDFQNLKLLKFFQEKLKERLRYPHINNDNIGKLIENIRRKERNGLNEYALNFGRKDSKISPYDLQRFNEAVDEDLITEALNRLRLKGPRDPFLVFYAFISKYQNTETPASNDRQSLLFAISDLEKSDVINNEEAILISFLLGYFIGYGMCWQPIVNDQQNKWKNISKVLTLLYPTHILKDIIGNLVNFTNLNYYRSSNMLEKEKRREELFISKDIKGRHIKIEKGIIYLNDEELNTFKKWRRKGTNGELFKHFVINRENLGPLESIKVYAQMKDSGEALFDQIEKSLSMGEFSLSERNFLTALSNLD